MPWGRPFLLPCLVVSGMCALASLASIFVLKESNPAILSRRGQGTYQEVPQKDADASITSIDSAFERSASVEEDNKQVDSRKPGAKAQNGTRLTRSDTARQSQPPSFEKRSDQDLDSAVATMEMTPLTEPSSQQKHDLKNGGSPESGGNGKAGDEERGEMGSVKRQVEWYKDGNCVRAIAGYSFLNLVFYFQEEVCDPSYIHICHDIPVLGQLLSAYCTVVRA